MRAYHALYPYSPYARMAQTQRRMILPHVEAFYCSILVDYSSEHHFMRSILSNFLALVFSNVFALGLNFVYSIIIVTKLADAYGLQSAILSFAAIVTGISYLGLL